MTATGCPFLAVVWPGVSRAVQGERQRQRVGVAYRRRLGGWEDLKLSFLPGVNGWVLGIYHTYLQKYLQDISDISTGDHGTHGFYFQISGFPVNTFCEKVQ